jgi:hypothetical protein
MKAMFRHEASDSLVVIAVYYMNLTRKAFIGSWPDGRWRSLIEDLFVEGKRIVVLLFVSRLLILATGSRPVVDEEIQFRLP